MNMRCARLLAIVASAWMLVTWGCGPQPAAPPAATDAERPRPAVPKKITAAIMGDPRTLRNVINAAGGSGSVPGLDAVEELVNVGLALVDNRGRLVPRLADEVPTLENGLWRVLPDGRMETTWRLRRTARWHDGTPVVSSDFAFTAAVGQDRDLPVFRDQMYSLIDRVEANDAGTVTVHWKKPFIEADTMFSTSTTYPLPRHLLERAFLEDKANFTQLPYWHEEFVGTGPYRVREWATGSHLVLGANDGYALGRPRVDEIQVRFIPDSNTLMANILAGAVQLTLGRSLSLEQAIQVGEQSKDWRVEASPVNWIAMYPQFLNPTPAVVGNVVFRRAVYQAVERQQLADSLQGGLAKVAHSVLIPGEPEFRDVEKSIVRYEFDPRRSVQLIESLAYARGSDGIFRDTVGHRLSLELRTVKHDLYEKALLAVGDYLARVGVATEPLIIPPPRVNDREYRAAHPAFEVIENPNDMSRLTRLRLAETPLPENRFTGRNRVRYMNPEFDALLEQYFTTIAKVERAKAASEIIHHMTDQLIWMGLFHQAEPTVIDNRLQNVSARQQQSSQAWNAHEWDVVP